VLHHSLRRAGVRPAAGRTDDLLVDLRQVIYALTDALDLFGIMAAALAPA
jgi:hypothetical protein